MNYIGDFNTGVTVRLHFTTHTAAGALVAPSSAFAASDFRIYKDGSATERSSTAGITVTSPFDSITGRHLIAIDTSNNTDAGFYAAGSDYRVEINSAKTVDGQTQSGVVIGTFSILNRSTNLGGNAPSGWINAAAIASDAITSAKIADNAITAAKIASAAITAAKFGAGAIDATAIADNAITAAKIATAALTAAKFAASSLNGLGDWPVGKTGYRLDTVGNDAVAEATSTKIAWDIYDDQNGWADTSPVLGSIIAGQVWAYLHTARSWPANSFAEFVLGISSSGGGGDTKEDTYNYFTTGGREDAFKADVSGLLTSTSFTAALPTNFNLFSIDGSGKVQLTAAAMATLFDDSDAATQLSDFFTGLIERFDASGDTAVSTIAAAVWAHASYAAAIRAAIGLAAANLDTQIQGIDSKAGDIKDQTDQLNFDGDEVKAKFGDSTIASLTASIGNNIRTAAYNLTVDRTFLERGELRVIQRDDYAAADGRAYEVLVEVAGVNFTAATVVAGAGTAPGAPTIVPTVTLQDKAVGSCTLRLEFTSASLDVEPGIYYWDAHIVISGRRNTIVSGRIIVDPKFADASS